MNSESFSQLLNHISSGGTIEEFLAINKITFAEIYKYLKTDSNKKRYQKAIDLRSDLLFEQIIQMGLAAQSLAKDEVQACKLGIDTLKWVIAVQNPKKYGGKPNLEDDAGPQTIMLNTGIDRTPDEDEQKEDS